MGFEKIVCWRNVKKYYEDDQKLIEKYRDDMGARRCVFCQENIKNEGFQFVVEADAWWIIKNPFPYKNSLIHLLIIPKRHVISLGALYPEEWSQVAGIINALSKKYPFLLNGYGLAIRDGEIGGVTLFHLHWHLIVPEVKPGTGQIPVNFGIG